MGKAEINFLAMNLIGNFTSPETVTSGCKELTKLYKERASWNVLGLPTYDYSDEIKKGHLIKRMRNWNELAVLMSTIELAPTLTSTQVRAMLESKCNKLRTDAVEDSRRSEHERATVLRLQESGELDRLLGKVTLDNHTGRTGSWEGAKNVQQLQPSVFPRQQQGQGWSQHGQGWPQQQYQQVQQDMRACFNCGNPNHMSFNCFVPFCYHCGGRWQTITDPRFHHNSRCPTNPSRGYRGRPSIPLSTFLLNTQQQSAGNGTVQPSVSGN